MYINSRDIEVYIYSYNILIKRKKRRKAEFIVSYENDMLEEDIK